MGVGAGVGVAVGLGAGVRKSVAVVEGVREGIGTGVALGKGVGDIVGVGLSGVGVKETVPVAYMLIAPFVEVPPMHPNGLVKPWA